MYVDHMTYVVFYSKIYILLSLNWEVLGIDDIAHLKLAKLFS